MKLTVLKGATSQTVYLFIRDSSATTGAGLTGLAYNSGSLVASYVRPLGSRTAITLATQTVTGAWSSGGFVEVDATNMPGVYRLDVPDAVFASGVNSAIVMLKGATNMEPSIIEFALEAVNAQDAVRMGLTALPNANAEAAGGLYTRGTGAGQINQTNNGQIDANAVRTGGTTNTGRDIGASVLLSSGTGTGQISLSSGAVLLQATQTGVTIPTVTTLTNAPSDSSGVTTLLSRLSSARAGYLDNLSAGAVATASALSSVASDVTTLLSRITSTLFSGITSLAQWLGLLAGKQTGNSTARTELRATGAGSGTFDETTDSQEALRDRGDAAWTTATGFSTLDAAGVRSAVGLGSANLDTQLGDLPTNAELATALGTADDAVLAQVALVKAVTDKLDETLEDDGGTYRFTANALEEGPSGGSAPSAADIADAVWEESLGDHSSTSGSVAEALAAAGGAGDPWITPLPGSYTSGQAGKIVGDALDAAISSRAAAAVLGAAVGASISADIAAVKAETASILTDTAEIGAAGAGLTALASAANLATVAGYLDTEIAAILADTNELQTDWANGGRLDLILDSRSSQTSVDDLPTNAELATALDPLPTAAENAQAVADLVEDRTVIRGTCASGSTTTTMTPSSLSPNGTDADQFKGRILIFDNNTTTAALRGQATDITANTAASLPLLTFTALTTAPASGDTFSIV